MAGYFLEILSIIDKRIDIYLAWTESGYGLPIDSYGPLYLHICVLILYAIINYNFSSKILELRPLVYLEYLGIIIFLSFSDNAIFAYRLTNVITSLYFILIAKSLSLAYSNEYTSLARRRIIVLILCCIIIALLMRTGNSEILAAIYF